MSVYLREEELERIGEQVFEDYRKLPEAWTGRVLMRVQPELLLKKQLGLEIVYRDLRRLPKLLNDPSAMPPLGYSFPDDDGPGEFEDPETGVWYPANSRAVVIEEKLLEKEETGRRNFTMAHEASHHILWHLFPKTRPADPHTVICRHAGRPVSREEWQADRLASAILMPRCLVEQAMFFARQEKAFRILDAGAHPEEYERFCNMCGMLGVSKQALGIRMKRLGLLERMCRPFQSMDIYMEDDEKDG